MDSAKLARIEAETEPGPWNDGASGKDLLAVVAELREAVRLLRLCEEGATDKEEDEIVAFLSRYPEGA